MSPKRFGPGVTWPPGDTLQPGDGAGLVGADRLLHLHGLEDDDQLARRDLLALLDGDLDDGACTAAVSESPEAASPDLEPP